MYKKCKVKSPHGPDAGFLPCAKNRDQKRRRVGIALGMAEQNRNMFDFVYLIIIIPNSIVNIFCKKFFKIKKRNDKTRCNQTL
ncbi:MAG: hypothetical protein IJ181_05830 [Acidaminococcaceae bacterium]|nr:hypothetical protein [Acidaminococcaceae bacterium]MBQ9256624.1 hypothetical protein [Acidaminococcaceae bacterium]